MSWKDFPFHTNAKRPPAATPTAHGTAAQVGNVAAPVNGMTLVLYDPTPPDEPLGMPDVVAIATNGPVVKIAGTDGVATTSLPNESVEVKGRAVTEVADGKAVRSDAGAEELTSKRGFAPSAGLSTLQKSFVSPGTPSITARGD